MNPASPMAGRRVYVVKADTVYVVADPHSHRIGEREAVLTIDNKYAPLGAVAR